VTPPQTLAGIRPATQKTTPKMDAILTRVWARVLIPSLSDLFFLAVLIWLFMSSGAAGWQGLLADADVGWHIRTGEYILDHHAVPRHDLYSFSKPDAPWYAWEWLTDVIDGGLHRVFGLKGIVLMAAILISLYAISLIRRMVSRDTHLFVALAVALLGVGGSSMHFLARPHLLTLVLLSISVWMIEDDRLKPSWTIWLLVPLTIVWTNLHGGFLALTALVGIYLAGNIAETLWTPRAERDWSAFGQNFVQTLEPRAYYVYVPFKDQSKAPVFDTAIDDFNFAQLFSPNRYLGNDRIGDANQITVGLTSRLLDPVTGGERLRVAVAERFYFADQRVTLSEAPRSATSSDFLIGAEGRLSEVWALGGLLQYNFDQGQVERFVKDLGTAGSKN